MGGDVSDLIDEVMALRSRAAEIAVRIRKDADILAHVHHELAAALNSLAPAYMAAAARLTSSSSPTPSMTTQPPAAVCIRVLRIDDVADRLGGISRSQVWRMVKDKRFPKPRRLGLRAVGWLEQEVSAWITERPLFDASRAAPQNRRR